MNWVSVLKRYVLFARSCGADLEDRQSATQLGENFVFFQTSLLTFFVFLSVKATIATLMLEAVLYSWRRIFVIARTHEQKTAGHDQLGERLFCWCLRQCSVLTF